MNDDDEDRCAAGQVSRVTSASTSAAIVSLLLFVFIHYHLTYSLSLYC